MASFPRLQQALQYRGSPRKVHLYLGEHPKGSVPQKLGEVFARLWYAANEQEEVMQMPSDVTQTRLCLYV